MHWQTGGSCLVIRPIDISISAGFVFTTARFTFRWLVQSKQHSARAVIDNSPVCPILALVSSSACLLTVVVTDTFYLVLVRSLIMASLSWLWFSAAPWRTKLSSWQCELVCAALWWSCCLRFLKERMDGIFRNIFFIGRNHLRHCQTEESFPNCVISPLFMSTMFIGCSTKT